MIQKTTTFPIFLAFLCSVFSSLGIYGQSFGTVSSAVWLTNCNQSNFLNTTGSGSGLISPAANIFTGTNLGVYTQNSETLILRGAEVRTFKETVANVCSARLHYRIYLQSGTGGAFNTIDLPLLDDCDIPAGQFPSGGACEAGNQKWNRVIPDGASLPYAPVNLTAFAPGNYFLEVYYEIAGSASSTTLCNETDIVNNGGNNFKASFSIQAPVLASNNPTTCNGTEGLITISGLAAGASYTLDYTDDGIPVGPVNLVANGSGQAILSGLNAGVYSNLELHINGCTTEFFTGIILSNPVFTPTFTKIATFCAGSIQPILPAMSNNGISGVWSPAIVNNQNSGSYIFTPTAGQCGLPATMTVTVIPKTTPAFGFGTALTICSGGVVPTLSNTSENNINGTWSPSIVDNQNSGTYTFTPTAGLCALPATFTVTVNPNITPTFSFGTTSTICAGGTVPALPITSIEGITGTWSPSTIDNQNSGTYTFTPTLGLCALPATFTVTVNPNIIPTFSFGTSLNLCANASVPALPTTSTEGITGTWNPATVSDQASGTYTFTPTAGLCALPATFTVTVNPNITPTFGFGTALTVCANGAIPALINTSSNGITGTWSPSTVDDQNSGTYTFTPTAGLCALPATFTVTVNPNITPTFNFGTTSTICAGTSVPALTTTSIEGITGTWSPAIVDNQNSGTYTFTPTPGLCAMTATFTVTVDPNIVPTFVFGTSLNLCADAGVPALPTTSTEGITGTWNPATVSDQASGTYTFTPTAGLCALPATFTVTVNPNITPTFSFETALTICAGGAVPTLINTSSNGIIGTWSPSIVDNQNSGTYTFTPTPGLCATTATFTVTVNPNIVPSFGFGTSLNLCTNASVPALPAISTEGITGTWNPATVSDQTSDTYTFTPTAGLCALPATFTVTVSSNVTPTFSIGTEVTICAGGMVPALPITSVEGISGTWSPATVSDQTSGTYTFTPTAGLCALPETFTVTVNPNIIPTFGFGTALTICADGTIPVLINTSSNGITGIWSPAIIDNQNSGTYTFTPTPGLCALPATFTVTVNPNITPTFSFGTTSTICAGASVPALTIASIEGITGTWSPAIVDNQNSGTYTFTPTPGLCALPATFTVIVNPNIPPTFSFGTTSTICAGAAVPALTTTSIEGITGIWSPTTVDDQNSGSYTFTPTAGLCATTAAFTVTVNPNIVPTFGFGTSLNLCTNASVPALPAVSTEGITGTWNLATVSDQVSGTYTFTPTPGLCALPATFTVTVNPNILPIFNFGTTSTICAGAAVPALTTTSIEGITGTWNPATVSDQTSGTYTFTPTAGLCATPATFTVTVDPNIPPTFSFGTTSTICAGAAVPALTTTSIEGITGTWSPAIVDDQNSGSYTFTPTAGLCATTATFTVTVNSNITPTFSFGTVLSICTDGNVPTLTNTSTNGITGTWSPSIVDNQASGNYIFTPAAGECAIITPLAVTVNPVLTPVFGIGTTLTICSGNAVPALPALSTNDISGTWSPADISNQASAIYTFTPAPGECATPATFSVTVTPTITPVFSFGTSLTICTGATAPLLPVTSMNGVDGVWSTPVVNNQASAEYLFTPTATPEQCIAKVRLTVTVKPILTPTFSFGTAQTICAGSAAPSLPATSLNDITGTWNPATVNNQASATYTFTSAPGQCAKATATFTVTVKPVGTVNAMQDTIVNDGAIIPVNNFSGTPTGVTYTWTNSNTAIGLAVSGTGNVPAFTATNRGNDPVSGVITVTPTINGCPGAAKSYVITVKPLNKDVFVPNVFSPNGDGKNDILYAYGNYIDKLDMRIFNQWGEQVVMINNPANGWDGTHRGKAQPVGVYVYTLQAILSDGRTVKLKGSITLLR